MDATAQEEPTPRPMRRIAHLDMDAFFASVELLRQPQLKGLPLVVGGGRRGPGWLDDAALEALPPNEIPLEKFARLKSYVGRGVITTATYEARQFGIGSAMGMMKAAQLCPEAYRLPADFDEYRRYSRQFKHVITAIAPVMEDRGIDEVYIDFTDVPGGQREGGRVLARLIQKSIFEATGLTCSIGVAPNKLLAKMASEFNKPHGISILHEEDLQTRIWPLPCRKINGIGPKSGQKLEQMDIHSIGELAAQPLALLIEQFGKSYGAWLHAVAWGRDDRPLETESEPVSMSRETTFERDLHAVQDRQALSTIFSSLCERVAADLQRKGYVGRTIGIKIRYGDFRIATRAQSIDGYTSDVALIRQVAGLCLKRVDLQRRFRLLGVKVDGLRPAATPGLAILSGAQQSGHKKARQDAGPQLPLDFG